jgi:CheY-like chemotaxis protein
MIRTTTVRRILVVDDNRDSADSLSMMLKLLGHQVTTVYDGADAIDRAAADRPEVALLDLGMPRLSGFDVARRIRERPECRDVMLVAVTGWSQDEDRQKTRDAGFDAHLVKPADVTALEELLAGLPGR